MGGGKGAEEEFQRNCGMMICSSNTSTANSFHELEKSGERDHSRGIRRISFPWPIAYYVDEPISSNGRNFAPQN